MAKNYVEYLDESIFFFKLLSDILLNGFWEKMILNLWIYLWSCFAAKNKNAKLSISARIGDLQILKRTLREHKN